MASETAKNLQRMKNLRDPLYEAARNASITFEYYLKIKGIKMPAEPTRKPYPKKKTYPLSKIYKEVPLPRVSRKYLVGLIVGPAVFFAVALPTLFWSLAVCLSPNDYGWISIIGLVIGLIATVIGLVLLVWGLRGRKKANEIRNAAIAKNNSDRAEAQERLNAMNAEEGRKREEEIEVIDAKYEEDLKKHKADLEEYRKVRENAKLEYDKFVEKNRKNASYYRSEYEKLGKECFPDVYQSFPDLDELISIALSHPTCDIYGVLSIFQEREERRRRREEEEARRLEEEWRQREQTRRQEAAQEEHNRKMEEMAKRQQDAAERQTGSLQCMNCQSRSFCAMKKSNRGDCLSFRS